MKNSRISEHMFKIVVIGIALFAVLFPFFWLISTSLKFEKDIFTTPPVFIPSNVTFKHYIELSSSITPYLINSCVVAVASTILATFLGSLGAYSLSRVRIPFHLGIIIAYWVLMARMYPAICTAIPYFIIIRNLHLIDTRWALIITYTSFNLPLVIWLMIGFYGELPIEIEESAKIDGCGFFKLFWKVVAPLSIPSIVVSAIFSFILAWNEFLFAVILTRLRAQTIPVKISTFIGERALDWGQMSGMGIIIVIPVLLAALLLQKHFVRGLTFGAIK